MDVLHAGGASFLGSRLKRLGERLQAGAARVSADAGLAVQPAHMAYFAALDRGPQTIGQLVRAIGTSQPGVTRTIGQLAAKGLVRSEQGEDQRQRTISLTAEGTAVLARAKTLVLPQVAGAVEALLGDEADRFLEQIAALETALLATPLELVARQPEPAGLGIREYSDELAHHFRDINAEWIEMMFTLEPADLEMLDNPRPKILDPGGLILFVEAAGLGIVGTGALLRSPDGPIELVKMGVRQSARGLKAGEFLLTALIERAIQLGANPLFLVTNSRCEAAIHLYEKQGFRHNAGIRKQYGARYERCDVGMLYSPDEEMAA